MWVSFKVDPDSDLGIFLRKIPRGLRSRVIRFLLKAALREGKGDFSVLLGYEETAVEESVRPEKRSGSGPESGGPSRGFEGDDDPFGALVV